MVKIIFKKFQIHNLLIKTNTNKKKKKNKKKNFRHLISSVKINSIIYK